MPRTAHRDRLSFKLAAAASCTARACALANAQTPDTIGGWQMQDAAKVSAAAETVSSGAFRPAGWYRATVPGTVLTTLVDNKVYPEPLYGENMRQIPESLNKASYWFRTEFPVPASFAHRHTWVHFGGINYSADVWVDGHMCGTMRGAFIRGDFDVTPWVRPGHTAVLAVLIHPQPHPGVPHEHTIANGLGANGGETAIDGPTFLSTIGWDWLPAVRDRDTGLWQPVTLSSTGPVVVHDPFVVSDLNRDYSSADLHLTTTLENLSDKSVTGELVGTISGQGGDITFRHPVTLAPSSRQEIALRTSPASTCSSRSCGGPTATARKTCRTCRCSSSPGPRRQTSKPCSSACAVSSTASPTPRTSPSASTASAS